MITTKTCEDKKNTYKDISSTCKCVIADTLYILYIICIYMLGEIENEWAKKQGGGGGGRAFHISLTIVQIKYVYFSAHG